MMENNKTISNIICCPVCKKELNKENHTYFCNNCNKQYEEIDGIIDFFPDDSCFFPQGVNIKDKYEEYGEFVARKNSFQNNYRKELTLKLVSGELVLEIGAAEGWMSKDLSTKVSKLVSCDIAMSYLKRAKSSGINAEFFRIDAHYLPFVDESFDVVIITEVLEHLFSPYRALEEIHRVLKPDGVLILSTPNNMTIANIINHLINRNIKHRDAHLSFYDVLSLKQLLSFVGFETLEVLTSFIYFPGIKPLFYSKIIQKIMHILWKNFGDKIIVKARKTEKTLWKSI